MLGPRALVFRSACLSKRVALRHFSKDSAAASYDIVIVGGGPAGLALAAAIGSLPLASELLNIALVEASDLTRIRNWNLDSHTYSNRVSSITNASREFLHSIGVWQHVEQSRTSPIESMQVWDGISDSRVFFSNSDIGNSPFEMARLTENLNLQRALLRRLDQIPGGVELIDQVKVESITRGETWPVVNLSGGRSLRTRLLIGADGFNSPVRSFAQIGSSGWAYPTHAVVATLHHPLSNDSSYPRHNTVAYQRFLPTGPIAFLPLTKEVSSMVWSTSPQLASILGSVHPDVLSHFINAAFRLPEVSIRYLHSILLERGVGGISPEGMAEEIKFRENAHGIGPHSPLYSSNIIPSSIGVPPTGSEAYPPLVHSVQAGSQASFPLRLSHADSYVGEGAGERTALVGDAAHTIHPLAGQGLNMGLEDARVLAQTIGEALSLGSDIGSYVALIPYHIARYTPNHAILSVTDKLHKLYALTTPPAVWVRSIGLEVLNELGPIKGALMGAAGSKTRQDMVDPLQRSDAAGWHAAATVIESLSGAIRTQKALAGGLGGLVSSLVQNAVKNTGR